MPYNYCNPDAWKALAMARKARKRKHDEIVRLWQSGRLSWNEYCRQEKKYRV
jgi:hypothetical protein